MSITQMVHDCEMGQSHPHGSHWTIVILDPRTLVKESFSCPKAFSLFSLSSLSLSQWTLLCLALSPFFDTPLFFLFLPSLSPSLRISKLNPYIFVHPPLSPPLSESHCKILLYFPTDCTRQTCLALCRSLTFITPLFFFRLPSRNAISFWKSHSCLCTTDWARRTCLGWCRLRRWRCWCTSCRKGSSSNSWPRGTRRTGTVCRPSTTCSPSPPTSRTPRVNTVITPACKTHLFAPETISKVEGASCIDRSHFK